MKGLRAVIALMVLGCPATAPAQAMPDRPVTTIILHPAAEPIPALKYRLVPERRTLVPGNAAVFYHRAIQLVIEPRLRQTTRDRGTTGTPATSADSRMASWMSGPIAKMPRDEAASQLRLFQAPLAEVELGAARAHCDWEFDRRTEGIRLLIPEIQEMRALARLVGVRARLAILDGKSDEAMHWIETGMVMGRHVAHGPMLIQALVGIAIDGQMRQCLEDLLQAPAAPSLYWALADRPRPFIDMRYPMEGERSLLERELPELEELDRAPWSLEEARRFTDALQAKLFSFVSGESIPGTNAAIPPDLPGALRRLGIAAMAAKIYPEARRNLIARGRPAEIVDAMPIVQASALFTLEEYQRVRDESYKWLNFPYWQSYNRIDRPWSATVEQKLANPLLTLFSTLAPALNSARLASIRLERQLDVLQCIEAIRLYAAAHGGKFPDSLEELSDAPAPIDPATGKPFHYAPSVDSAMLWAPLLPGGPNHPSYEIHYVLRLAK
jgi:hypothetical protein